VGVLTKNILNLSWVGCPESRIVHFRARSTRGYDALYQGTTLAGPYSPAKIGL
jgi:hypothetical protein